MTAVTLSSFMDDLQNGISEGAPMIFKLRLVDGQNAKLHAKGEWQLFPENVHAHDFARRHLNKELWVTVPDSPAPFTFVGENVPLSAVKRAVRDAGISNSEILVESNAPRASQ
jgi:hypothetical protein